MATISQGRFAGRRAVVTGGASGIGQAVVRRLVAEGGKVAIWDRDGDAARAMAGEVGGVAVPLDLTDWSAVETAAADTVATLGGIDVLVCSAGISGPTMPVVDYPIETFHQIFDINVFALFYCNKAVVPGMLAAGYGRIVNIASIAGKEGNPNASAYSASKAAVIAFTKSLSKEVATSGVLVNAVTPAAVRTPIFDQISQSHIDYMLSRIPMGRFGTVDEIAATILFAASEDCAFTTGSVFDASGGRATF